MGCEQSPKQPFVHRLRVRYHEIDGQSHVYNSRYLEYLDAATIEFLRALGWGPAESLAAGFDPVLARVEMDFRSPARLDEDLAVAVRPTRIGKSSFAFAFEVAGGDGRTVLEAVIAYVNYDSGTRSSRPIPGAITAALESTGT